MFSKPFKQRLGDCISSLNYSLLALIGNNLPQHVTKYFMDRLNKFKYIEHDLNLQTDILKKAANAYQVAMTQVNQIAVDNFSKYIRHAILFQLANNAINTSHDETAIVAECGCWKGQSAHVIASVIKNSKINNREFHIFDSFEGLSEYFEHDLIENISEKNISETRRLFAAQLDLVQTNLKEYDFIHYHKGWIPQEFPKVSSKKFCFVNIDVDLFEPIRDSLEFFYPRLIVGGAIFLDDYAFNQFPGASKAIDDFVRDKQIQNFVALPTGGAFIIK